MTGLVLRYDPFFQRLQELVRTAGPFARVEISDDLPGAFYMRRWHRLKSQCRGLVLHEGIHSLDIVMSALRAQGESAVCTKEVRHFLPVRGAAQRCLHCSLKKTCPHYLDAAHEPLSWLYATPRMEEGFPRDLCVFNTVRDVGDRYLAMLKTRDGTDISYRLDLAASRKTRGFTFSRTDCTIFADEGSGRIEVTHNGRQRVELFDRAGAEEAREICQLDDVAHQTRFESQPSASRVDFIDGLVAALAMEVAMEEGHQQRISYSTRRVGEIELHGA